LREDRPEGRFRREKLAQLAVEARAACIPLCDRVTPQAFKCRLEEMIVETELKRQMVFSLSS